MNATDVYRKLPAHFALPLAFLASALIALLLAIAGVVATNFFLRSLDGPGAGVLIILIAVNIGISGFVTFASILASLHHRISWRVPTVALGLCVVLIRSLGPLDLQFAPFVLGTGAVACIVTCWTLQKMQDKVDER